MLECLLAAGDRVVSAEELLERVWDEAADPFTTAVKTTMRRLRAKLGDPPVIRPSARADTGSESCDEPDPQSIHGDPPALAHAPAAARPALRRSLRAPWAPPCSPSRACSCAAGPSA